MDFTLTRSKNRRRSLSLKVIDSGEIIVRAPLHLPRVFINHFVNQHSDWIAKEQAKRQLPRAPQKKYYSSLKELENHLGKLLTKYSDLTGLKPKSFRLRQVSSYWGSCSPRNVLSFNTRLQYAPPECVEYIVVHELSHLKYKGHGRRFWDYVEKHYPNLNSARRTLRLLKYTSVM